MGWDLSCFDQLARTLAEIKSRLEYRRLWTALDKVERFALKYSEDEPRDYHGRWTDGGGSSGSDASSLYKAPTKTADQIIAEHGAVAGVAAAREKLASSVPTDALVKAGGFKNADGTYTADRQALHEQIVNGMFTPSAVAAARPAKSESPELTMLGGRGGSGKSWLTGPNGPVDGSKAILLDADGIKAQLPGYAGWNAALYHQESTDILALADRRAIALGVNTIHDATMKSDATAALRMAAYEAAGYRVNGYYMYASPETAAGRALSRFSKGGTYTGRFVPPEVILGNTNNEKNFDKLAGGMQKWAVYDNNTKAGPRLVAKGGH